MWRRIAIAINLANQWLDIDSAWCWRRASAGMKRYDLHQLHGVQRATRRRTIAAMALRSVAAVVWLNLTVAEMLPIIAHHVTDWGCRSIYSLADSKVLSPFPIAAREQRIENEIHLLDCPCSWLLAGYCFESGCCHQITTSGLKSIFTINHPFGANDGYPIMPVSGEINGILFAEVRKPPSARSQA